MADMILSGIFICPFLDTLCHFKNSQIGFKPHALSVKLEEANLINKKAIRSSGWLFKSFKIKSVIVCGHFVFFVYS